MSGSTSPTRVKSVRVIGVGMLILLAACGGDGQGTRAEVSTTPVDIDVLAVASLSEPRLRPPAELAGPAELAEPGHPLAPAGTTVAAPPTGSASIAATAGVPAAATAPVPVVVAPTVPPAAEAVAMTVPAPQAATLSGVVTRGGQPAPGVRLTLVAGDGTERVTIADETGAYQFIAVTPGAYELMAYGESGATCDPAGCISASWAERVEVSVAAGEDRHLDVDGD